MVAIQTQDGVNIMAKEEGWIFMSRSGLSLFDLNSILLRKNMNISPFRPFLNKEIQSD